MTGRVRGGVQAAFFGAMVTVTDLLPPRVRYGYVHRLTRRVLERPLPRVERPKHAASSNPPAAATARDSELTCVLATFQLDVGGVGAVVEMLARRLGAENVRAVVVCEGDGSRAAALRASGVEVLSVSDAASARAALERARPDVIELHSAPPFLEKAAIEFGVPLIPVMHNTEIHFTRARWREFSALMERSAAGAAVSETVRDFHVRHVSPEAGRRMTVIPNGAPHPGAPEASDRAAARRRLGDVIGSALGDDLVVLCLARYDSQKNIAGTVASFLAATPVLPPSVRLVVAGDPSDWAELLRADGIRRQNRLGDRVHLLGNSDAVALLHAADVFLLNSFFEGWPVAATEASAVGLPLVLSDVGGARELVRQDCGRSVLVANPSGPAADVSDARVASARRSSRRQDNVGELAVALRTVLDRAGDATALRPPSRSVPSAAEMTHAHAVLVRAAASPVALRPS